MAAKILFPQFLNFPNRKIRAVKYNILVTRKQQRFGTKFRSLVASQAPKQENATDQCVSTVFPSFGGS